MPAGTATSSVFPVGKATRTDPPCAIVARGTATETPISSPRVGWLRVAGAAGAEQFRQDVRIDRTAFGRKPAGAEVEAEIAEVAAAAPRLARRNRNPRIAARAACLPRRSRRGRRLCASCRRRGFRRPSPTSAKRSFAFGSLLWSGWYFLASLRNADLISASLAVFGNAKNVIWITHYEPISSAPPHEKAQRPMSPFSIWPFVARGAQVRRGAAPVGQSARSRDNVCTAFPA